MGCVVRAVGLSTMRGRRWPPPGLSRCGYSFGIGMCDTRGGPDGLLHFDHGANAGIGLETAKDLARRGARVLMACRDPQRGQKALEVVRAAARGDATVELLSLDLASLDSVRDVRPHRSRLRSPASTFSNPTTRSNHFGPFLFTLLLVDLLKKSAPARIVFVSSGAHEIGKLTPERLEYSTAKDFGDMQIYSMTKLGNVLVSNELARRLKGTGVTVNSLHPGVVLTDIYRFIPWWIREPVKVLLLLFFKNAEEGAQTTIHLAVSEEVEGVTGRYFSDCKEARMSEAASNVGLARTIWEKSEQLVKLRDNERPTFD
ncbi:Putative dehydrogenase with different specificities related to short-chain alcohol dehydrogenase [Gryllus bimaculatus]|nr:Putative dehydrogenase with different specificities related to short-chain alcohol dehydrogenase [Gryllus bimaculatus]